MDCKIKIIENGPYLVSGNVPLVEKIILYKNHENYYGDGRTFPLKESYTLCRCGHSKTMPFCDGSHLKVHFDGTETATKELFVNQAEMIEGTDLLLMDVEKLCAFARLCHKTHGDAWDLTEEKHNRQYREEAIQAACDCPSGRLVVLDRKAGKAIEPVCEPSIAILQDPNRLCSGPLWVRGRIPIEAADGTVYEIRDRVTLCRCGESENKPFCDATHVSIAFNDKRIDE